MEEFNLSDKISFEGNPEFERDIIDAEDVKEFIKIVRENYLNHINKHFKTISAEFIKEFDELAGPKLI